MPRVASAVKANFPAGTPFGAGLVPDEVVAVGATIQAFLLQVRAFNVRHRIVSYLGISRFKWDEFQWICSS